MTDRPMLQTLRAAAWARAKEELLFILATFYIEDPKRYWILHKFFHKFIQLMEQRVMPK